MNIMNYYKIILSTIISPMAMFFINLNFKYSLEKPIFYNNTILDMVLMNYIIVIIIIHSHVFLQQ